MYRKLNNILILNVALKLFYDYLVKYYSPVNINYIWNAGFVAGIFLAIQIASGFFLTLFYLPHIEEAFSSVEYIMRDVNYGWLIRYLHLNGASFFFLIVYIHILKAIYYGSYKYPRIGVYYSGVVIYLLMMASAFLGYVLPWGQMSFWACTVITNLFAVIPFFGKSFIYWVWGGFSVNAATLTRFFSLHYLLPFVLLVVVLYHLYLLHITSSSHGLGYATGKLDKVSFFPFFIVKDLLGILGVLFFYFLFVFFTPEYLNHTDNSILANPLVTPPHIVPEWYFLPFYGVLKTILNKLYGVVMMFASMLIFLFLPYLDVSRIKGSTFVPRNRLDFWGFAFNFICLGYVGIGLPVFPLLQLGTIASHLHFSYFFIFLPSSSFYSE